MKIEITPRNPRIVCKDGVSLSVQCNLHAYCEPRDNKGPYTQVEVGFVRFPDEMKLDSNYPVPLDWKVYADDGFPSDVYGYVPCELVEEFIKEHGGIDLGRTYGNRKVRTFDTLSNSFDDL